MVLLQGHSLTTGQKLSPDSLALNLEERGGSATLSLGPDQPDLAFNAWLLDDTQPGQGIVWRVRSVDNSYHTETRTVQLEHIVNSLRDRVLFGTYKPEDMGGSGGTVNARTAINFVLGKQYDFQLGAFSYDSISAPFEFTGDTIFEALETITSVCPDAEWSYDFSVYPFKLNIVQRYAGLIAEMRGNRNMQSCRKTVDRSGMYTRLYPIGKDNLHLSGNGYVSKNEGTYGTVCKIETDDSLDTEAKLLAWANERLNRHCEPKVSVTISGLDLSQSTGENLDTLRIGKQCRVPMPEFGTTITERIVKLSWRDKINQPEAVTVTLANTLEDVATIIRRGTENSGRGGAAKAKKKEEDHAWFVDNTEKVGLVAEAVAGTDAQGKPNWSLVSQIMVDGKGIHQSVTKAQGDIITNSSRIEQTENKIALIVDANGNLKPAKVVAAVTDSNGRLRSEILVSADHIMLDGDTTLAGIFRVTEGMADFTQGARFGTATTIFPGAGVVSNALYTRASNGNLLQLNVANVQVDGNTLTITYSNGLQETFSKAVSLPAGTWSGTVAAGKSFKYTATQNGAVVGTGYSPQIDDIYQSAPASWDNDYKGFNQKIRTQDENGVDLIEEEIHFDTTASWTAGKNSVTTITPTAINVYTSSQGTVLGTRLSESILTAGKYITFKVGSTTYSIPII